MQDNIEELTASLNGHQVTDENGELGEETTSFEDSAPQETNTEEETASSEKSAEPTSTAPKAQEEDSENELAEDESGKRYVPEARFKEVYGKLKAYERGEIAPKANPSALPALELPSIQSLPTQPAQPLDQASALEVELLKVTLPQFNPDAPEYSSALDALGDKLYKAAGKFDSKGKFTPGITRIEAAKQAIATARTLTQNQIAIQTEARKVKALQSDQGITSRVTQRQGQQLNPNSMSLEEKEAYLRSTGEWDKF